MLVKGAPLRDSFDLTIAVAAGFFRSDALMGKSGDKGERSASPDSNEPLRYRPP
ncbi:hypothetical protein [Paenibacillus terrae]|uniref:hypothetical protein n=1 Tax=Paenibacillus terrae TaxID=159743 RepID=UPI001484D525|nr:hypothetical protein [Paenibacillus terrae]